MERAAIVEGRTPPTSVVLSNGAVMKYSGRAKAHRALSPRRFDPRPLPRPDPPAAAPVSRPRGAGPF
ncbi:hypothetical protein EVAR_64568_1 [Eumeta japonica]|uniref:Uncharacterized protein n=1 Tax=Eumeta variegata TaxID=151549 RepID=A0A4C1ZG31_EUMVA|nr:hypothetical protein EVAR_64568_1 [Eumeta japonica]